MHLEVIVVGVPIADARISRTVERRRCVFAQVLAFVISERCFSLSGLTAAFYWKSDFESLEAGELGFELAGRVYPQ